MSGYQTPFDLPDPLAQSGPAWQKWAGDIDSSSQGNWTNWASDPLYTYGRMPKGGVEFDPLPTGESFTPESSIFGYGQTAAGIDSWMQQRYPGLYQFNDSNLPSNPGQIASPGGDWSNVERWDSIILAAIQKVQGETGTYVPANLVKAIMRHESGGDPNSLSLPNDDSPGGNRAQGLMQVMPFWFKPGDNPLDPMTNVTQGVRVLAENYKLGNPENGDDSWEWAAKRYLGLGGADANGSTADSYWETVNRYWNELGTATSGTTGGGAAPTGTTNVTAIWGGFDAPLTQDYGKTDFSDSSGGYYDFGAEYTRDGQPMGHTGIDVGVSYGSKLYTPLAGTVIIAGGSNYYCDGDGNGCGNGVGELRLKVGNDEFILGHMSQITVKVGDIVQPGQFVGYSGSENGAHVHVEYRRWVGEGVTKSGFELIDPRQALKGNFAGSFGDAPGTGPVLAAPANDWQAFMRNAAQGLPVKGAATIGGFSDWLRQQMGVGGPKATYTPDGPPTGWIYGYGTDPTETPTTPGVGPTP